MAVARTAVGCVFHTPRLAPNLSVGSSANRGILRGGQFCEAGVCDDGVCVCVRRFGFVLGRCGRLPSPKVADCFRGVDFLLGDFPFGLRRGNRAACFYIRGFERLGAGVLLSAHLVAFGAALRAKPLDRVFDFADGAVSWNDCVQLFGGLFRKFSFGLRNRRLADGVFRGRRIRNFVGGGARRIYALFARVRRRGTPESLALRRDCGNAPQAVRRDSRAGLGNECVHRYWLSDVDARLPPAGARARPRRRRVQCGGLVVHRGVCRDFGWLQVCR